MCSTGLATIVAQLLNLQLGCLYLMQQLIYKSKATVPFDEEALSELLLQSRSWNHQEGITGVLLYSNERFVQVLEGSVAALSDLYGRLLRDPRHETVIRLVYRPIVARRFAQWSMAFHTANPEQMEQVLGYVDPDKLDLLRPDLQESYEPLFELIQNFVQTNANEAAKQ